MLSQSVRHFTVVIVEHNSHRQRQLPSHKLRQQQSHRGFSLVSLYFSFSTFIFMGSSILFIRSGQHACSTLFSSAVSEYYCLRINFERTSLVRRIEGLSSAVYLFSLNPKLSFLISHLLPTTYHPPLTTNHQFLISQFSPTTYHIPLYYSSLGVGTTSLASSSQVISFLNEAAIPAFLPLRLSLALKAFLIA